MSTSSGVDHSCLQPSLALDRWTALNAGRDEAQQAGRWHCLLLVEGREGLHRHTRGQSRCMHRRYSWPHLPSVNHNGVGPARLPPRHRPLRRRLGHRTTLGGLALPYLPNPTPLRYTGLEQSSASAPYLLGPPELEAPLGRHAPAACRLVPPGGAEEQACSREPCRGSHRG